MDMNLSVTESYIEDTVIFVCQLFKCISDRPLNQLKSIIIVKDFSILNSAKSCDIATGKFMFGTIIRGKTLFALQFWY